MSEFEIDVLVVGSGAAGLPAALTAAAEGARVMVAEAEGVVGGAARLSAGMIMAAGSRLQRETGLDVDAETLYREYLLANQYMIKPGIARRLAYDSGPAVDWLADLGVRFFQEVMQGGGEPVPRSHVADGVDRPGGQHIVDVLAQHCQREGVEIALGNRVERLLQRDGAVVGVRCGGEDVAAGAVVLASGGFHANPELIAEYLPSLAVYGDLVAYNGPASARGDALTLGAQVGASVVGHDRYVAMLTPRMDGSEFGAYLPGWMLLLGPDGRRFCDETTPYGQTYGVARAVGEVVYGLFDAQTLADNGTPRLDNFKPAFPTGSGGPPNIWTTDNLERLLETGAAIAADTLAGVAERLGLPVDAVAGAVDRYNGHAARGEDRDFLKPARFLRPLVTAPFYGVEIRPSMLGSGACGLEIDTDGHVLDAQSREIPGLFAAGEAAGGVIGTRYMGSGNSWARCLVFGRAAGRSAALHALAQRATPAPR